VTVVRSVSNFDSGFKWRQAFGPARKIRRDGLCTGLARLLWLGGHVLKSAFGRLGRLLRAGIAGLVATGADVATLSILVGAAHWAPRTANVPALAVGAVVNFIGNRDFAFRARQGHVGKQALGYSVVEIVALGLNGLLYDTVLRVFPVASHVFWLVRLGTTNLVFLVWSYPLWAKVFRVRNPPQGPSLAT
jgi:putative flippase GtrA